jgi:hypothetical protein
VPAPSNAAGPASFALPEFFMWRLPLLALATLLLSWPTLARNEQPAGGAFMSSYRTDPYFDPRSRYSQARSLDDIGGQPMLTEPFDSAPPCRLFDQACARRYEAARRQARP